jgi:hypothetical protein
MERDRYQLNEFTDFQEIFLLPNEAVQRELGNLIRRSELTYVSSKGIDDRQLLAVPLQIHLANSTSANVGRTLLDLEIELRRTASYLETGKVRPSRNNEIVELISASHNASIDLVVAVSMEIYRMLASRPIDFLLLLDWFWTRRHNRTKVRSPYERTDPTGVWNQLVASATDCVHSGHPVVVTMRIDVDGSATFQFRSP